MVDLVKMFVPKYKGIFDAFQKIYRDEGIKGLYKGFIWTFVS